VDDACHESSPIRSVNPTKITTEENNYRKEGRRALSEKCPRKFKARISNFVSPIPVRYHSAADSFYRYLDFNMSGFQPCPF
jgi:hypothetical protein